jgi:hypothetical protein
MRFRYLLRLVSLDYTRNPHKRGHIQIESKLSTRDTQHTSASQQARVLDRVRGISSESDLQSSGSSYVWRRNAKSSPVDKMPP